MPRRRQPLKVEVTKLHPILGPVRKTVLRRPTYARCIHRAIERDCPLCRTREERGVFDAA